MKCSFAKMSTKGVFKPVWPYGTDLYGRFLYLEDGDNKALIAAFDFLGTYKPEALRWKRELSEATGIPEKAIWYHELQVHAAPESDALAGEYMDNLIARSIETVREMMPRAEEFDCYASEIDMGTDYTFNREQYVEGLGGVTVWTGMSFDEHGRPYSQNPKIMLLRGYDPKLPVFDKPIYFDNPNDQMAYFFRFVNRKGETIGTVSRFAAHPDVAVLFELRFNPNRANEYHYCFDWPGFMTEENESVYGGVSMYLNGPCADLSTKKSYDGMDDYAASEGDCRRLGKLIGDRIRMGYEENHKKLDLSGSFKADTFSFKLPMKDDMPRCYKDLETWNERVERAQKELDDAIAANLPAPAVKHYIDERWRASQIYHLVHEKSVFTEEELASRMMGVEVTALSFGGYLFVGVPGESLVDMTYWLRSRFTGTKTIPVDQVNGYFNYMATPRSLTLGGYTYWSSWVTRESIPTLKKELAPKLDEFLGK